MRKLRLLLVGLFAIASITQVVGNTEDADAYIASGQGWYSGYFYGNGASGHYDMIGGGLPNWAGDSKANFISFILSQYNTGYSQATINTISTGNAGFQPAMNKLGAAYVIQTMRGGTDHAFPDAADIADWQAKINSPSVTMQWGSYSNTYNSARSNKVNGVRDVYGYWGDGSAYRSILFYANGSLVYAVKQACANPMGELPGLPDPTNFSLTPTISVTPGIADAGSTVGPRASVNNTGTTSSTTAQWQVSTFALPPGSGIPAGGQSSAVPTTFYGNGATTVTSGSQGFGRGVTALTNSLSQTIPDRPVGWRVCYALSVQPYTQSDGRWNHSTPACVTVSKKPKVQVLGSDLIVGSGSATNVGGTANITTSKTTKSGQTFGSWAEYGIVASGLVTNSVGEGMSSGAGYARGAATNELCRLSILTFSIAAPGNANCAPVGNYTKATIAPNVSTRFPINVTAANARPGVPANPAIMPTDTLSVPNATVNVVGNNLSGHYQVPAGVTNLTVTGGDPIPKGRWIVINAPSATVTITGDIRYTGDALNSLADIPQVVIIANNIIVAEGVQHIDAWLVAVGSGVNGRVNTCGAGGVTETSALVYTQCSDTLTVNGPVIANHLIMRRTAGSGTGPASGEPAEVFNLRADAYLWATEYNLKGGRLPTVSTKELPPRF